MAKAIAPTRPASSGFGFMAVVEDLLAISGRRGLYVDISSRHEWPWPASAQRVLDTLFVTVDARLTMPEKLQAIKALGACLQDSPLLDVRAHGCAYLFELDGMPEVFCGSH
jgi:hypothetical protein